MERINPVFWAPPAVHKISVDWEKTVREQGGDPAEIEKLARKVVEES